MKRRSRPVGKTEVKDYPAPIFPEDLNSQDKMFGGMLVGTMDKLGGSIFFRHTEGQSCGTVYIDGVTFLVPAYKGDLILLDASINRVWNTSCEIGIRAKVQRRRTGVIEHLSSTYLTYVATDELEEIDQNTGYPRIIAVPIRYDASPLTQEQKRRWREADKRRQESLKRSIE